MLSHICGRINSTESTRKLACWIQAGEMQWYKPGVNAATAEA